MAGTEQCPACGAANPVGSEWCGQCYAAFGGASSPSKPDQHDETARGDAPATAYPVHSLRGPTARGGPPSTPRGPLGPPTPARSQDRPGTGAPIPSLAPSSESVEGWVCKTCGAGNPVAVDECRACRTSIYDAFGASDTGGIAIEPSTAALWGLLPGGGHFKTGQSALGLAVAGLLVATVAFGVAILNGNRRAVGFVLLGFGLVAWGISIFDATRFATGNEEAVLLRPRVVTSAMGLVFMLVIVAAVSITGEGSTP